MDLSKYRALYISETQENLEKLGQLIVELEGAPTAKDTIDTVFRLFHSIKGMSGTMGYDALFELSHQLEDLMDLARLRQIKLDAQVTDVLLEGVDHLTRWVDAIDNEQPIEASEADQLRSAIRLCMGGGTPTPTAQTGLVAPPRPEARDDDLWIHAPVAEGTSRPGVRAFVLHRKLQDLGEVLWVNPPLEALRRGQVDGGVIEWVLRSSFEPDQVASYVRLMPEFEAAEVRRGPASEPGIDENDLLFSGDLDLVSDLVPEPLGPDGLAFDSIIGQTYDSILAETLDTPIPVLEPPEDPVQPPADSLEVRVEGGEWMRTAGIVRAPRSGRSIRVKTEWLDTMLDGLGDLLIISQRLWNLNQQQPRPAMTQGLRDLARSLGRIRSDAMTVRMTPMSVLTNRLPRVVRDLARQAGKRVGLTVRGHELQLDRAIIEGLDSPLTHLLRNAVEHGIEPPDVRREMGKNPVGQLIIECERVRDEIVVRLRDDGGGIDREKLAAKAVGSGLIKASAGDEAHELLRLISLPGLSASAQAGDLSGRGVGMDAVIDSVTALGGEVQVSSERSVGTTFTLSLPRTPGISKLLLVEADGQIFGLPLGRIINSDMFEATAVEAEGDEAFARHGDARYRLHFLRGLLGFGEPGQPTSFPGVLCRDGEQIFVLAVDRVVGQQDAVIKPLGPLLERIDGLLGVTIDAVGQPVFVVDVTRFPTAR